MEHSSTHLNKNSFSQIPEIQHKPARISLKPYWYTGSSNYANINLPPEFIQQLQLTIECEVTAEIVTTSNGHKGILILKQEDI